MSGRRSSRLANKNRFDYNEKDHTDMNLDQVEISSSKEIVQIVEDAREPSMKNDLNSFVIVNDEKQTQKFERITKVNKAIFRQASKTLSDLKSAIESTKSAVYSLDSCLKGENKSLFGDNASIVSNDDDNKMDIDEVDVINDVNDNSFVIENDDSHNVHNVNNSLKTTKNEGIEDLDLDNNVISNQEDQPLEQDIRLQKQDQMDVDYQQPIPQFTLMLSDDLKEAFKPNILTSTSLEDIDMIVYDPTDPDFNNDDLIVTIVERKQNMTTRRKIRSFSSKSQTVKSINLQTNTYDQFTKEQDTSTSHIVCIDDKDDNLKNKDEKQETPVDGHERQEQQDDNMIDIDRNESKVQEDQSVIKDESELCKGDKDIKNSTPNENSHIKTASQSINKDDSTSNKLEIQKDNSEDENFTDVIEEVVIESSGVSKFQEVSVNSMLKPSSDFESIKNKNSQSDLISAENLERNLNDNNKLPFNDIMYNKKNKKPKSNVKKNPKNAKSVESTTELISSPSIPNSSVSKVVPTKRPVPDDSKTSEDILGPYLELLDENRKNGTSLIQKQSATNITDVPSNSRAEMIIPYSSMTSEEHRKYLQIEAMIYQHPKLVSKEEHNFYQYMSERVINERKNFERWQFERSKLFIGHLNQIIENKVMNYLKHGRQSNINDYSKIELTIGLNPVSLGEPELKFKQKLSSIGKLFEFSIPSTVVNEIPFQLEKELWLDDIPSVNTISTDFATKGYWEKTRIPVVSQDPLIPEMLSNHKVDFVISSGGLVALVGLAESTDVDLEIPIKIVETTKENSTLKTIYIDKPFVKKKMSPREINQVYYNTAIKSMALKMNNYIPNVENKDDELKYSSHNLEYSLWNIDDISILIRCKSHGYYRDSDQKIRTVGIKSKLDYQLDYNYESISFIEQSRWWIYSLIRNKADLMLGRINVPMNTLNMVEKVSAENILPDENRVKSLIKKLHYIFKELQCSLFQGSYILRHEKGEAYAVVYKSVETAKNYFPTSSHIEIDRKTISFVPLVWKGLQAQIINTFPIRTEQIRGPPKTQRKSKKKFNVPSEKSKSRPKSKSKPKSKKSKDNGLNGGWKDNDECDDLQYIVDQVIEPKIVDLDNMEESSGSSAPDFATLLNNFKK